MKYLTNAKSLLVSGVLLASAFQATAEEGIYTPVPGEFVAEELIQTCGKGDGTTYYVSLQTWNDSGYEYQTLRVHHEEALKYELLVENHFGEATKGIFRGDGEVPGSVTHADGYLVVFNELNGQRLLDVECSWK